MSLYSILFLGLAFATGLTVAVAWCWPLLGNHRFSRVEDFGRWLARHKRSAVILVGVSVIVLRLAFLPFLGVPVPELPDDFCNLLAADTFAHGHLTNPTHPMSRFFETFLVIQSPTYMSIFSPAQGAVLALGQLLGSPWIGVLLSVACLCAALTWALQAWLPARWALLGGVIAVCHFAATNYWMESYFGGALPAIGGTLIIGALPNLIRRPQPKHAIVAAVGAAILANTRPYEGLLFCIGVFLFFVISRIRQRGRLAPIPIGVIVPFAAILTVTGGFIAYYNWRITGRPTVLPWALGFHSAFSSPIFIWGTLQPPRLYPNPQFQEVFSGIRRGWLLSRTPSGFSLLAWRKTVTYVEFFTPPQIALPILVGLFAGLRSKKILFSIGLCGFVGLGTFAIQSAFPHYLAPVTACIYVLSVCGFRYLRRWKSNDRPVGLGIARALLMIQIALLPLQAAALGLVHRLRVSETGNISRARAEIERYLENTAGNHLVIVQYPPAWGAEEWVYNRADIDHAKVVWARHVPGQNIQPLLDYFPDRDVWITQVGPTARVSPFPPPRTSH